MTPARIVTECKCAVKTLRIKQTKLESSMTVKIGFVDRNEVHASEKPMQLSMRVAHNRSDLLAYSAAPSALEEGCNQFAMIPNAACGNQRISAKTILDT